MSKAAEYTGTAIGCLLILALAAALSAFAGWLFYLAWNWAVPSIFGGPRLTFLQAWGLFFLISLVAQQFRSSGGGSKS